jgi:hypothetical protein
MTLHMLPEFAVDWMFQVRNAFLIRDPRAVLASYAAKRDTVTSSDIGFMQQRALFERVADRLGAAPPVIDAADVLANPSVTLERLCLALGIPYTPSMLRWPAGRRPTDGVWAPAWYASVERSTGFEPHAPKVDGALPAHLQALANEAQPHYEALRAHRLGRAIGDGIN